MNLKKKLLRAMDAVEGLAEAMREDYSQVTNEVGRLQRELDCAEDYGHEYVFVGKSDKLTVAKIMAVRDFYRGNKIVDCASYDEFTYKCSRCGRTVDYTWDELSTKEKNALKTLGVVK